MRTAAIVLGPHQTAVAASGLTTTNVGCASRGDCSNLALSPMKQQLRHGNENCHVHADTLAPALLDLSNPALIPEVVATATTTPTTTFHTPPPAARSKSSLATPPQFTASA